VFNLSFSSVVNLLHRHTEAQIREILSRSFLNFRNLKAARRDRRRLDAVQRQIAAATAPSRAESNRDKQRSGQNLRRLQRTARHLSARIHAREQGLFERFQDKVEFLKLAGYLEEDGSFNAGARALMHIQINEIFVTELLLDGVFEDVDEDELFGILTSIVHELPRTVLSRYPLRGRWRYLRERIMRVRNSDIVLGGSELMGYPVPFSPDLMPFGYLWAQGAPLAVLMNRLQSDIDVSGDLVGAFRRAKDLAGQLREVYREDPIMRDRLSHLMEKVSRDEVEVID